MAMTAEAEVEELEREAWYHGLLPRTETEPLLREAGDFLVRATESGQRRIQFVLTHRWNSENISTVLLKDTRGVYRMPVRNFRSVVELIHFFTSSKEAVTGEGALILSPVPKRAFLVSYKDLELDRKIGKGNFGEIFSGRLSYEGAVVPVAVRCCRLAGEAQREGLMKEARLLLQFLQDNVVRAYAVAYDRPPLALVLEQCDGGRLDRYLRAHQGRLSARQKLRHCLQAARGLEFLHHSKNVVHRDLSARACLVGGPASDLVKIAGFGLAQQGPLKLEPADAPVHFRWAAPESLAAHVFLRESDVWAFAVLCWEVFTEAAHLPWPALASKADVYQAMRAEESMDAPPDTPQPLLRLLHSAWSLHPYARPTMAHIRLQLERIDKDFMRTPA